MFIHYGENQIISEKKIIGIFNTDSLNLSEVNNWILDDISEKNNLIIITEENTILTSIVSPFTIIKRSEKQIMDKDILWRKINE